MVSKGKRMKSENTFEVVKDMGENLPKPQRALFSSLIEDSKTMDKRMTALEKSVSELKDDVKDTKRDVRETKRDVISVKEQMIIMQNSINTLSNLVQTSINQKRRFWSWIGDITRKDKFWAWLIIITCLAFGVSYAEINGFLGG